MNPDSAEKLHAQYERFPYPPVSFLALPRRHQGLSLRYETGTRFLNQPLSSAGIRILIVGGGTLEPLIVGMAHPKAAEMTNVELSERSIAILGRRLSFSRLVRPFSRMPPLKNFRGDIQSFGFEELGLFDYILASNVLHHTADPERALIHCARLLKPGGLFRLVTYPCASRHWMRATSAWLRAQRIDRSAHPKRDAFLAVKKLSITNPIRTTFESHPERHTNTGVIDAFFSAQENPLTPLEWQMASEKAGLSLIGESQEENSRSNLVDSVAPGLTVWEKLQIMDDTWELCANPVLWFKRSEKLAREIPQMITHRWDHPFCRADALLKKGGSSLSKWRNWLAKEVGPRVWPGNPSEIMRGHSITEYPLEELLKDC